MPAGVELATLVEERLLERNRLCEAFFAREAPGWPKPAAKCRERFLRGGRLLAFGRGPYATDAQHVSVEFVHPVIVGKRALPALDMSMLFRPWLRSILRPEDIVMGFGPPAGGSGSCRYAARGRGPGRHDLRSAGHHGVVLCRSRHG